MHEFIFILNFYRQVIPGGIRGGSGIDIFLPLGHPWRDLGRFRIDFFLPAGHP
jgi:hypothetical protein